MNKMFSVFYLAEGYTELIKIIMSQDRVYQGPPLATLQTIGKPDAIWSHDWFIDTEQFSCGKDNSINWNFPFTYYVDLGLKIMPITTFLN